MVAPQLLGHADSICLIVAVNATKYYTDIDRILDIHNMHYIRVLSNFKINHKSYTDLKDQGKSEVTLINDQDNNRKVIECCPIFQDYLERTYGTKGPLVYVLRGKLDVPTEVDNPLDTKSYYNFSGSLHGELIACPSHTGSIYKLDNALFFYEN